ncbi:MAG: EAL domain-containing protein [Myxococcota bacterium]
MLTPPRNILLLEDSDSDAAHVQELLEGLSIQRASTLEQALLLAGQGDFDLALLDLHVPDAQGHQALLAFKRFHPDIPVVVMSGTAAVETAVRAVEQGAQDYLVKGRLDRELIRRSIRHARSRHELARRLVESERRYALAMEGAYDGLWEWDLVEGSLFVSRRWKSMLGHEEDAEFSHPADWMGRIHPVDLPEVERAIQSHLDGGVPHIHVEHRVRTRDGALLWVLTRGVAQRSPAGRPLRVAGSMSDISRFKQAEARLRHEATHDRLTGLPNRALLIDRLQFCIQKRRRQSSFAVLFIDLDRFKMVNDTMGHAVGDEFLRTFVRRIRPLVRPSDTFARLGGDEFCLLLEDTHGSEDPERVADRIHAALQEPLEVARKSLFASASIGVADSSQNYQRPEDMIRDADIAMYRAKAKRSGSKRAETAAHGALVERFELENELRFALDRGEMFIAYQPIVGLESQTVRGYEALLRWRSPRRGVVKPETFIPIAKEMGILGHLGRWTLGEACTQIASLGRTTGTRPTVSVNLSPLELLEQDLVGWLESLLERSALPPECLILEVTEDVLLEQTSRAFQAFAELKRTGISIDLDDFGTGFSSLSHLRQFPVDRLKVDKSFVQNIQTRKEDREIVRAIVALGRTLGKQVVAEGIETQSQLAVVRSIGCDFGQGWYFGHPGPLPHQDTTSVDVPVIAFGSKG